MHKIYGINHVSYPWSRAQPLWAFILLDNDGHLSWFYEWNPFTCSRWTTRSVCVRWLMCTEQFIKNVCGNDSVKMWLLIYGLATLLRTWPFCMTLNWTGCKHYWPFCVSSVSDGHGGLPRSPDWPILSLPAADPHLPTSGQLWCTKGWGGGVWAEQGGLLLPFCHTLFIEKVNLPYLPCRVFCLCCFSVFCFLVVRVVPDLRCCSDHWRAVRESQSLEFSQVAGPVAQRARCSGITRSRTSWL